MSIQPYLRQLVEYPVAVAHPPDHNQLAAFIGQRSDTNDRFLE